MNTETSRASSSIPGSSTSIPIGPREEQCDQWRSLKTHSVEKLMSIYKEIYFAGFPCRIKQSSSLEGGISENCSNSGRYCDESVTIFPQSFVYDFFKKYGVIEQFSFDEDRGIGSVTFADGEVAESCYLSSNLSLVQPPPDTRRNSDQQELDEAENQLQASSLHSNTAATKKKFSFKQPLKPIVIYLEFAQSLAFVNTPLLMHDQLRPAELSRQLLRTLPCVERKLSAHTATHVVMEYFPSDATPDPSHPITKRTAAEVISKPVTTGVKRGKKIEDDSKHDVVRNIQVSNEESGTDGKDFIEKEDDSAVGKSNEQDGSSDVAINDTPPLSPSSSLDPAQIPLSPASTASQRLQMKGPFFPCGAEFEVPELQQSLWRVLQPCTPEFNLSTSGKVSTYSPSPKQMTVTALDLWFEYYWQFILHKTQPSSDRIKDSEWRFAQRPSVVQEINDLNPSNPAPQGGPNKAHRLMHDSAFHQICTMLMYKLKFKNDPSWASFMRDIFTSRVKEAVAAHLQKRTYKADLHFMHLQKSILSSLRKEEGEEEWLELSHTQAAENAIENLVFLRQVELGEVNRKTGIEESTEVIKRIRAKNRFRAAELRDPFTLIIDFSDFVDRYAASGSASGLLAICEDPKVFRRTEGHVGFNAVHHRYSVWKLLWEIFWMPITLMVAIGSIVFFFH